MKRWMDWLDEKRDTIGEKLSKKEMKLPIDIVTGVFFLLLGAVILLIMPKQVPVSPNPPYLPSALAAYPTKENKNKK